MLVTPPKKPKKTPSSFLSCSVPRVAVSPLQAVKATAGATARLPVTVVVDSAAPYILAHAAAPLCIALHDAVDAGASKAVVVVHRDVLDTSSVAQ